MEIQTLYIIDSVEHAKAWLKYHYDKNEPYIVISLNPDVYTYLLKRKIIVHTTDRYFTNDSHKKIVLKADQILSKCRQTFSLWDIPLEFQNSFREKWLFELRSNIQYYLFMIELLSNADRRLKPKTVGAFDTHLRFIQNSFMHTQKLHIGPLIQQYCQSQQREFLNCRSTAPKAQQHIIAHFKRHRDLLYFFLKNIYFLCFRIYFRSIYREQTLLVHTTRYYDLGQVAEELKKKMSCKKICLPSENRLDDNLIKEYLIFFPFIRNKFSQLKHNIKKSLSTVGKTAELMSYRGVHILDSLMTHSISYHIPSLIGFYIWRNKLTKLLTTLKPKYLITAGNRGDELLIAEVTKKLQIQSVMIGHGSAIPVKNVYEKKAWGEFARPALLSPCSHVTLPTPLTEKFYENFNTPSKKIKTGPLTWGRTIKKENLKTTEFTILHASTSKYLLDRPHIYETQDEYLASVQDTCRAICDIDNIKLIIKFRSQHGFSEDTLRQLIPNNDKIILISEGAFLDVLVQADLLITFSSTCTEEALQNNIPVLFYGAQGRYQHVSATEVLPKKQCPESAVYAISHSKDLKEGLIKIRSVIESGINNHAFQKYQYHIENPIQQLVNSLI